MRAESLPGRERLAALFLAAVALVCLAGSLRRVFLVDEATFVTHYSNDDTYYFLQVARNLARGNGPSFDGLEWTNGFQPVWCLVMVPLYWVIEDPSLAGRWCGAASLLTYAATVLLLARLLWHRFGAWPTALAAAAALASGSLRAVARTGMDWAFNGFLEVLCLAAFVGIAARSEPSRKRVVLAGFFLGINACQRPDTTALAFFLLCTLWGRPDFGRLARHLALGFLLPTLPYFGGSLLVFGTAMPVSGELKTRSSLQAKHRWRGAGRTFDRAAQGPLIEPTLALLGERATGLERLGATPRRGLAVGLLAVGVCAFVHRRRASEPGVGGGGGDPPGGTSPGHVVAPLVAQALVHVCVVAVFLHTNVKYGRWYFAPEDLLGLVLLVAALALGARLLPRPARRVGAGLAVLGILSTAIAVERREAARAPVPADQEEAVALEVARSLREDLPAGARIGVFNAGRLGYYTDGHVTNLDGLVNTHEFAHALYLDDLGPFKHRFLAYCIEARVEWLLDVWHVSLEESFTTDYFPPGVGEYLELVRTWPVREKHDGRKPASFQLYRFDIERLLESLE